MTWCVISDLLDAVEETVNEVSGCGGHEGVLVLLDLLLDKRSHHLDVTKRLVLTTREVLGQPWKNIVHLWKNPVTDIYTRLTKRCFPSPAYMIQISELCKSLKTILVI